MERRRRDDAIADKEHIGTWIAEGSQRVKVILEQLETNENSENSMCTKHIIVVLPVSIQAVMHLLLFSTDMQTQETLQPHINY